MSTVTTVLLVILIILVIALIALYFWGKKAQKKQDEQQAQIEATKQTVSMLIKNVCLLSNPVCLRWLSTRLLRCCAVPNFRS